MSKYDTLNQFLGRLQADYWRPTFLELERILEFKLPAAAKKNAAWWEKDAASSRQAHAWVDAGWKVEHVDLDKQRVTFVRDGSVPEGGEDAPGEQQGLDSLAQRLRDSAYSLGDWADQGRGRAAETLKQRPLTSLGVSAGLAFAAGIGLGYLLVRSLASPSSSPADEIAADAEDRAHRALAALTTRANELADAIGERWKNLRG